MDEIFRHHDVICTRYPVRSFFDIMNISAIVAKGLVRYETFVVFGKYSNLMI